RPPTDNVAAEFRAERERGEKELERGAARSPPNPALEETEPMSSGAEPFVPVALYVPVDLPPAKFAGIVFGTFAATFVSVSLLIGSAASICRWLSSARAAEAEAGPGSEGLSDSNRKEVDDLRSSAIRRHLEKFTTTYDRDDLLGQSAWTNGDKSTDDDEIGSREPDINEDPEPRHDEESGDDKVDGTVCDSTRPSSPLHANGFLGPVAGSRDRDGDGGESLEKCRYQPIREAERDTTISNCAICCEEFQFSDRVCRSSNPKCGHIYHEDCVMHWLVSLGWTKVKEARTVACLAAGDEEGLMDYDLECPCCRRPFVDRSLLSGGDEGGSMEIV
ncbi:hypothetical protein ACHAWF_002734, partial [Thalassiosira exigua]